MPEATFVNKFDEVRVAALENAAGAGEVRQLGSGLAAFYYSQVGANQGDKPLFTTSGQVTVKKANGVVILDGGELYWDHSANEATYKPSNDRDFYLGTAVGDWQSADTFITVNLNVFPTWILDLARDPWVDAVTGTQALGGFLPFRRRGGAHVGVMSATSEAQKVDMLSRDGFAKNANAIVKLVFNVVSDGAGTVVDVSMGLANATHATDADSIAESLFIHLNANDVNIYAESDDGTNEVAATDTTIDYTEGTPVEVWFDLRNEADIQVYVNAALVLGATVFRLDNATGPLKLLVHIEKTSSTDTYELEIRELKARLMEQ